MDAYSSSNEYDSEGTIDYPDTPRSVESDQDEYIALSFFAPEDTVIGWSGTNQDNEDSLPFEPLLGYRHVPTESFPEPEYMYPPGSLMTHDPTIMPASMYQDEEDSIDSVYSHTEETVFNKENSKFDECSICLQKFKNEEKIVIVAICTHIYHNDCIDCWKQTKAECPLCRCKLIH